VNRAHTSNGPSPVLPQEEVDRDRVGRDVLETPELPGDVVG